jgi:large subunit ribosomal protein L13
METIVFDGTDAVFGRMASVVAKELLKGNSVEIINCEEIIVSGDKKKFSERVLQKRAMGSGGSMKGPKYSREADRLVKRMIRGMLPRQKTRGREAHKRLKCYKGSGDLSEEKISSAKRFEHQLPSRYSTMKEIVRLIK